MKHILLLLVFFGATIAHAETHELAVPASRSVTYSGIFIPKDQKVVITAEGKWKMGNEEPYNREIGLNGNPELVDDNSKSPPNGCLVAQIGNEKHYPENGEIRFQNSEAGLLLLYPNDGEFKDNSGELNVSVDVDSECYMAQAILSDEDFSEKLASFKSYPEDILIEITGEHIGHIIAVRDFKRIKDPEKLLQWFDRVYEAQQELLGNQPYEGEIIYFRQVKEFEDPDTYMLSGNPISYHSDATDSLISLVENPADAWGFIHEIGHNFSDTVTVDFLEDGLHESGANIFTLYTWETMNLPQKDNAKTYGETTRKWWKNGRDQKTLRSDYWVFLGLIMSIREDYGWEPFKYFYREVYKSDVEIGTWEERWNLWCRLLSHGAGIDLTERFRDWNCQVDDLNADDADSDDSIELADDDKWPATRQRLFEDE